MSSSQAYPAIFLQVKKAKLESSNMSVCQLVAQAIKTGQDVEALLKTPDIKLQPQFLSWAIHYNRPEIITLLIALDCPTIDHDDIFYEPPLVAAIRKGRLDLVKKFCNYEFNPIFNNGFEDYFTTAMHIAAQKGDLEILKEMPFENDTDSQGNTAIFEAISKGHFAVVGNLLKNKASLDVFNSKGHNPLLHACSLIHEKPQIVDLLLASGADFNARDKEGMTALHHASLHGHNTIVNILLEHAPENVVRQDFLGRTAIFCAAMRGHHETVKILAATFIYDINLTDFEGCSPLFAAVECNYANVVRVLLDLDAEADTRCFRFGAVMSPMSVGLKSHVPEIKAMFQELAKKNE